ncbi:hypothetical protein [Pseudomonas lactucae]|uniref:hypothetical protein n=1 Tax=Pseudomonas lactucae TaxID=2813360 RepID=UPI0038CD480F
MNRFGERNEAGLLAEEQGLEHFFDLLNDAKDAEADCRLQRRVDERPAGLAARGLTPKRRPHAWHR